MVSREVIEFMRGSLIGMYVGDCLDLRKVDDVGKLVESVGEFSIYEIENKIAVDYVLTYMANSELLQNSIIKSKNGWRVRLYKDGDHEPMPVDGQFYVVVDEDFLLLRPERAPYFKTFEEAEDCVNATINGDNTDYKVKYKKEGSSEEKIEETFMNFIKENNIKIGRSSVLATCEKIDGKYVFTEFDIDGGRIFSGDFSAVEEVDVDDCIIKNSIFNNLDITDDVVVKNVEVKGVLDATVVGNDIDNGPKIYSGKYNIATIRAGDIYGGDFNVLSCFTEYASLYNCKIDNFILAYLPDNFDEDFEGSINNVVVIPDTVELLKETPKLLEIAKNFYLYETECSADDMCELVPYKLEDILKNLKPLDLNGGK